MEENTTINTVTNEDNKDTSSMNTTDTTGEPKLITLDNLTTYNANIQDQFTNANSKIDAIDTDLQNQINSKAQKYTTPNTLNWINKNGAEQGLPFASFQLTENDDLDSITTYGVYQIYSASVPMNAPLSGVNAILTVDKAIGSKHLCQHYSTHTGYMFERYAHYANDVLVWHEWKQIATQIVQTLPAGSDANKLGKTALYATTSSNVTNIPTSINGSFMLLVYQGAWSGNVTQVIYTHNTDNTHTGIDKPCSVYVRDTNGFNNANPYWSAWTNLYTEANPSGEATGGVLSKILINDVIYSVGGGGTGTVDTEMSDTSTNAVQNKVIKNYVDDVKLYAQNTQQELNESKASLYGYVFGEDTANFSKLDISALPSMIHNNNVAYNTRLMLDTIKGRSVKWTQLIDASTLISSQTISGVTITTDKTNGTITVNGTATEDIDQAIMTPLTRLNTNWIPTAYFYLKGCPTGGSESTYWLEWENMVAKDIGNGVYRKINANGDFPDTREVSCNLSIHIKSGTTMKNKVFRPQVFNVSDIYGLGKEPATIADFNKDYPYSFYPYGKQEILTTKVSGIKIRAGYKNLCDYNKFIAQPTYTNNGLTITNNNDGTVTIHGTSTSASVLPLQTIFWDTSHLYYVSENINISNETVIDGGSGKPAILRLVKAPLKSNSWRSNAYYYYAPNTTVDNFTTTPKVIDLTLTYGAGNEPTTVAQFNQDFPDIDNIPYPEQTISFDEQTLYGINDVQDTLQVVKENDGYKLQKVENIGLYDLSNSVVYYKGSNENHKYFAINVPNIKVQSNLIVDNILLSNYITDSQTNVYNNLYNLTIATTTANNNGVTIYDKDKWQSMTAEEFKNSLVGQTLYYAVANPTTTTLATLTKTQVTALFAKGYCVEILGNDDNKIIVRPDLSLNMVIKLIGGSSTVDTEMSDTSINAVENKVIKNYVDNSINTAITTTINANY